VDVRLWPTLARFDLGYNPLAKISERPLTSYPNLWGNDAPWRIRVEPVHADWDSPHHRAALSWLTGGFSAGPR
jgi:glutathionyl-hydroquinone reductase